jgi:hypothetical protein
VSLLGSISAAAWLWSGPAETPPIPWAGHDALPREAGRPTTLFVNFDGAVLRSGCGNDARWDCSTLADTFDGYVGPFGGDTTQRAAILDAVRQDLSAFGVTAVAHRPPADVEYTMVLYGDLGPQGFAGVAPYIDCGDVWRNDTSFSQGFRTPNQGSTVILQEAAHTWGLEHVNEPEDILHPVTEGVNPRFRDSCEKIVSNTSLDESSGVCNTIHTLFCPAGEQNSFQELAYLFGPPIPDTSPPALEIESPADGSIHEAPALVDLRVTVHDDLDPQFYELVVLLGDQEIFRGSDFYDDIERAFRVVEPGEYPLTIQAIDEAGNVGEADVAFTYVPQGALDPELAGGCRVAPDAARGAPGAWILLARWRRRTCRDRRSR